MRAITVVVADAEKRRRNTCLRLLAREGGIQVIAEAATPAETLSVAPLAPRILLLDSSLARGRGILLLPLFRRSSPQTRVIMLSDHTSGTGLLDALAHGAHGWLNHHQLRALLSKAIRKVDQGESWVSRKMVPRVIDSLMELTARGSHSPDSRI